ncbi:MAG: N-acetylneuraminate synthase [Bdellovibrionota bacterium]
MDQKTLIIAEAGVNHCGDVGIAKKMISVAAQSGADFIKFQTFKADRLATKKSELAEYQKKASGEEASHYDMLKKLELSPVDFENLSQHCSSEGIGFMSTPFDIESLDFLCSIGMSHIKIASGEITNYPLLHEVSKKKKPVILSTGMATLEEIQEALNVLKSFDSSLHISVLHCNTEYPTPFEDINLKAMLFLKDQLKLPIGLSDHSSGILVPIIAVGLGATVIEKHFTLSCDLPGPDHLASLTPAQLREMVSAIRICEQALGQYDKQPTKSEMKNITVARKSIVANSNIAEGDLFSSSNLTVKRPGTGISPMKWPMLIGKKATKNYVKDDLICESV